MKKVIFVYVAIVTVFASLATQADARSIMPPRPIELVSFLSEFNTDPELHYAGQVESGDVVVDETNNQIRLMLHIAFHCPPGLFCAQVMPAPIMVTLPITHESVNSCGSRIYGASHDDRPVDGIYESLTVIDNTKNECPHLVALPATEVIHDIRYYDRINGGMVDLHSIYTGNELRMRY